ncbi:ECF transporter S component [Actinopolymorpha sp. NPDC004070]|uniref:ECF transporter S component n=1 Tax=Actinopolymorpha sp. NPDC004070 TaxID=3154548 RepID=UPI0033A631D7
MTERSSPPTNVVRLRPRSVAALAVAGLAGVLGFGWPFLTGAGDAAAAARGAGPNAPYLFLVLLPLVVAVVLAELTEGGMDAKAVAMLGVLAAAGTALRALSPGTGGFEPTLFLVILAARVFGAGFGFALGSVTILASGLATGGVGPWLPFQMVGLAWVGLVAGLLPRASGRPERMLLAVYAGVAGFAYGALLNLSFWPFSTSLPAGMSYAAGEPVLTNLRHYAAFYVTTSFGWDCVRAVVNAVLILLAGRVVLGTLRRAARRAAFEAPVDFGAPAESAESRESAAVEQSAEVGQLGQPPGQRTDRPAATRWASP